MDDVEAVDVQDTMDEVKAVVAKGAVETRILFQIPLPQVRFLLTPDQYTGQVSFSSRSLRPANANSSIVLGWCVHTPRRWADRNTCPAYRPADIVEQRSGFYSRADTNSHLRDQALFRRDFRLSGGWGRHLFVNLQRI